MQDRRAGVSKDTYKRWWVFGKRIKLGVRVLPVSA